jgi:serine/threonine protein kinase
VSARARSETDAEHGVHDVVCDPEAASPPPVTAPSGDARVGSSIGASVLEAAVAEGAMGRVYEARHATNGQRMAIKILHDDAARDPVAVERFKREYETAFGFDHPHIVQVREFGETGDGSYFMTMEYLHGEPLSALLAREGSLSHERALRIVCQMASALEHAHSFGVIHRDLKPANIFLAESDEGDVVKLLDFGSVKLQLEMGPKLTAYGMTVGSPSYMSPEQAEGKGDLDHRADVFALAAVAYELLTGAVAFDGDGAGAVLANILRGEPTPASEIDPTLPLGVDLALASGLRRDKDARIGSAREFAEALLRVFGLEGDVERHAALPLEEWSLPRRGRRVQDRSGMIASSDREARSAPARHAPIWVAVGLVAVISAVVIYFAG